jgi:hypothetical protein
MYASASDALIGLLRDEELSARITKMSSEVSRLTNGIKYYAVEVTSESGVQYGISAYDVEAEELYRVAMSKYTDKKPEPMTVLA